MNKIEQKARLWLMREKGLTGGQIRKTNGTPDFETPNGGFEVKLLYGDSIIFYGSQVDQLRAKPDTTILVFSAGADPVAEFPFDMIDFATRTWENIRIIISGGRSIRLDEETYQLLLKFQEKRETFDQAVKRLLDIRDTVQLIVRQFGDSREYQEWKERHGSPTPPPEPRRDSEEVPDLQTG